MRCTKTLNPCFQWTKRQEKYHRCACCVVCQEVSGVQYNSYYLLLKDCFSCSLVLQECPGEAQSPFMPVAMAADCTCAEGPRLCSGQAQTTQDGHQRTSLCLATHQHKVTEVPWANTCTGDTKRHMNCAGFWLSVASVHFPCLVSVTVIGHQPWGTTAACPSWVKPRGPGEMLQLEQRAALRHQPPSSSVTQRRARRAVLRAAAARRLPQVRADGYITPTEPHGTGPWSDGDSNRKVKSMEGS